MNIYNRNKLKVRSLLALTAIILISATAFGLISVPRHMAAGHAENGAIDLSGADFDNTLYTLDGQWEMYLGELYTPRDFENGAPSGGELLDVPYSWTEEIHSDASYATYRLTVLTASDKSLLLHIPEIAEAGIVWINGEIVHRAGQLGVTDEYVPAYRNAFVSFTPEGGHAEIVIQASNFSASGGGSLFYSFTLGGEELLLRDAVLRRVLLGVVLGIMAMAALYHLILFFANRKEKIYLWYVCYVAVILLRMAMESNGLLQLFLPGGLDAWLSRIYLLCFSAQVLFLALFTFAAFGIPYWPKKPGLRAVYAVGAFILGGNMFISLFVPSLPESLIYLTMLPFALSIAAATRRFIRNRRALAGQCMELYIFALFIFFFWGISAKVFLDNVFFAPALLSNLFMTLAQAVALTLRYAKAREIESLLVAENAMLDRQSRLRAELMETISHEARTPLAVLASYAGLVSMELRDRGVEEQTAADLDKVVFEAKRVADLIDSMKKLPFAREDAAKRFALSIGDVIGQTAELYRHILERADVQLTIDIPDDLPPVFGSAEELTQVLFNILQNAKNHTQRGTVAISARAENAAIRVTVTDTGSGIAPENLPHVFERGARFSQADGSGLGLAICRDIVEAHGGKIRIESELGAGTSVSFAIPIKEGGKNE